MREVALTGEGVMISAGLPLTIVSPLVTLAGVLWLFVNEGDLICGEPFSLSTSAEQTDAVLVVDFWADSQVSLPFAGERESALDGPCGMPAV